MEGFFEIPESFFEAEYHCMVSALKHVLMSGISYGMVGVSTPTDTQDQHQLQLQLSDTLRSSSSSPLPTSSTAGGNINMFLEAEADGNHDTSGCQYHMDNLGSNDYDKNNASTSKKPIGQKTKKRNKKKKSGKNFKGVRQRSNSLGNKWVAEIWDRHRGKRLWLGTFASAEEAARTYDRKAIDYRGDGASAFTNFPLDDYPDELLRARQCLRNHREVALANEPNFVTKENIDSTPILGSSAAQGSTRNANARVLSGETSTNYNAASAGATLTNYNTASAATDEAVAVTTMEDIVDPHGLVDDDTLVEFMDLVSSLRSPSQNLNYKKL